MEKNKPKIIRLLLCLCMAIFLWGYVTNMHNPVQTKTITNIPIKIENADVLETQNFAIRQNNVPTITALVEGRYSDIQNVSQDDIEVTMDLESLALKEGENNISVTVKSSNPRIKVVESKTPNQVNVTIEKLLKKEFNISLNITGNLPTNYILGTPEMSKEKVIVTGTKDTLNEIKSVIANVDIDGVTENIENKFKLIAINKVGDESNSVKLKDDELTVSIPIKYTKSVPIRLNVTSGVPNGRILEKYTMDKDTVKIAGEKAVLDEIEYISTEGLDLSRRYYDFDRKTNLIIPEGVEITDNTSSVYINFIIKRS